MIVNLKMSKEVKTLAPKKLKRDPKKLPSFCVKYQNSLSRRETLKDVKIFNDFLIQGTILKNKMDGNDLNILLTCDDDQFDYNSDLNVFNNLNTDLLLSLDGDGYVSINERTRRTPTPVVPAVANSSGIIPNGYRSILRTPSPTPKIYLVPKHYQKTKLETNNKDLYYNVHRLKEKYLKKVV